MEQQATAEAVRNWTLSLRDPVDCLTNKAALLEREASFFSFLLKRDKPGTLEPGTSIWTTARFKVRYILYSYSYVFSGLVRNCYYPDYDLIHSV